MPVTIKKNIFNYKTDNNINSIDVLANESAKQKIQVIDEYYKTNVLAPTKIIDDESDPLKIIVDANEIEAGRQEIHNTIENYLNTYLQTYLDNKFENVHFAENSSVLLDETLTLANAAAQAKETGDRINILNRDIINTIGGIKITFSDPTQRKQYIDLSAGKTEPTSTNASNWTYAKENCKPGDTFYIKNITGGTAAYAYGFINQENQVIVDANPLTGVKVNFYITAPAGAKQVVFNDKNGTAVVYKGVSPSIALKVHDISIDGLIQNGWIGDTNYWGIGEHFILSINPNDTVVIQANQKANAYFYVLTKEVEYNQGFALNPDAISTYENFTTRIMLTRDNISQTYIMPPDAKYLLFPITSPSKTNYMPKSILINGKECVPITYYNVQDLNNIIASIKPNNNIQSYKGALVSGPPNTKWYTNYSQHFTSHFMIPVKPDDKVTIKANMNYNCIIAVFTQFEECTNTYPQYYSNDSQFSTRFTLDAKTQCTYTMPSDAAYLYITYMYNTNDYSPDYIIINNKVIYVSLAASIALWNVPSNEGNYRLKATRAANNTVTYSWVPETT